MTMTCDVQVRFIEYMTIQLDATNWKRESHEMAKAPLNQWQAIAYYAELNIRGNEIGVEV